MEEELAQARASYLEEDDAPELDEYGDLGASARLSLLKRVAPGRSGQLSNSWPFKPVHEELLSVTSTMRYKHFPLLETTMASRTPRLRIQNDRWIGT